MTGGVTSDVCDDGMSAECVDTVEQFMDITCTVTSPLEPQHVPFSLVQIVQSLLVVNVVLMMSDRVGVSFTSAVHHQFVFPAYAA